VTTPYSYLPHTETDRLEMLKTIGVGSFEELLSQIPESVRTKELGLGVGLSELELSLELGRLAAKNLPVTSCASFLGGGSYHRYVPAVVPAIVSRSEFATAYTPYQPEVSQGTLQAIYEFQSAICLLTGMDVANASIYDGPTAAAEATLMAARLTQSSKIILPENLNPEYKAVVTTYAKNCGLELVPAATAGGILNADKLPFGDSTAAPTAALIIQYPNYYGCFEDVAACAAAAHAHNAKLIVVCDPIALGILEAPAAFGADIVVGDAQPCGNYLSFGGPSAGFMATLKENTRQLPGRIAGMTVDNRGQRAFTLTLQTREQHIRRAQATSNICTNQALNALAMLVYLTLMGPGGLKQIASISVARAHYLCNKLTSISGITLLYDRPFFNEFVIKLDVSAQAFLQELKESGILGGIQLSKDTVLVCVTEMNSMDDIDKYTTQAGFAMEKQADLRNVSVL
jgi:glycine dehydrogenase subunit 1